MTSKVIDPVLRYLAVEIARHRFVQDKPQVGAEALVGEVYEDISLCMSDIERAHVVIMRRSPLRRQRIVWVSEFLAERS